MILAKTEASEGLCAELEIDEYVILFKHPLIHQVSEDCAIELGDLKRAEEVELHEIIEKLDDCGHGSPNDP
jgi:hypothetical protein